MVKRCSSAVALLALFAVLSPVTSAQRADLGSLLSKVPGAEVLLRAKPALTTDLSMATAGVEPLDGFEPSRIESMKAAPRAADGAFQLKPGVVYEMRAESYCLLAGTAGPARGDGYLDAPLTGPMSDVVEHILAGAPYHPEIPQQDIQMLLWSILAHAKISDLSREQQAVAARLLTRDQITSVNGGALGLVPDAVKDAAMARLPAGVARVLSAEADLRDLIASGSASYEEMERVAVPADADGEDDRSRSEVPDGRWSLRDGVYVRYRPEGYQETVIQAYVPGPSSDTPIVRDARGRLARITDDLGRTIEITYDERVAPRSFRGDPGVTAWAISRIAYTDIVDGKHERHEAALDAWTLVGMPNGRGALSASVRPRYGLMPAAFILSSPGSAAEGDLVDDLQDRYDRAARHKKWYDKAKNAYDRSRGEAGPSADDVIDEQHYREGVDAARKLDFEREGRWLKDHGDSLGRMAARIHCWLSGTCSDGPDGGRFSPHKGVAVPGNPAGQRLGQSGRGR